MTDAIVEFASCRTIRISADNGETFSLRTQDWPPMVPGDRVSARVGMYKGRRTLRPSSLSVAPCKTSQAVLQYSRANVRRLKSLTLVPVSFELSGQIDHSSISLAELERGQYVLATLSRTAARSKSGTVWTVKSIDRMLGSSCEVAAAVALSRFGIQERWTDEVSPEIAGMSDQMPQSELNNRRDLRGLPFITIDPAAAKDHDDAVFCERLKSGGYRLWVAIADVAHYVKPATALDSAARARGASIYFPCNSVPMLPPKLSSQICSLAPGVDKPVIACEMAVNLAGEVVNYEFCEGTIRSRARLNYAEADDPTQFGRRSSEIARNLRCLSELNQVFLSSRNARGALSLDLPEASFQFDGTDQLEAVTKSESLQSYSMIEEAMLAANTCAAKLLSRHYPQAAMYRIHENPSEADLYQINELLNGLGVPLKLEPSATAADYQAVSERLKERFPTICPVFQVHLLRSLATAVYSENVQPHFALNYRTYTHFTSPIRRYPDLIVHRLIKDFLHGKKRRPNATELSAVARQSSRTERRAEKCSREAASWLKAEFMEKLIGNAYDGVITDIRKFGIFVQLGSPYVDGLVPVCELGDDEYFKYDKDWRRLVGANSGRSYSIGQKLRVRVADADREMGFINFELA